MSREIVTRTPEDTILRPRWPWRVVVAAWVRRHNTALIVVGMIASLAYYYLIPANLLALPGLLVFFALTWRRLDLALCVLPLAFPFWYVPKRFYGYRVLPLSEIGLLVCLAVALARETRHVRVGLDHARVWTRAYLLCRRVGAWPVVGAALLFVGMTVGVAVASYPHVALRAYRWEIAEPLLYALGVLLYVRGRAALGLLLWSFLAAATLLAALAILQSLAIHQTFSPLAQGNRLVAYGAGPGPAPAATGIVLGSGNSLGAWIERALPLALALGLRGRGASRRSQWAAWLCAAICCLALYWSGSRGAWLGATVGCLVVVVVYARNRWVPLALGVIVVALALWRRGVIWQALLNGHHGTGSLRLLLWLAGLKMIRDHPILGFGPDQFLYHYSSLYTAHPYWVTKLNGKPTIASTQPTLAHPHNLLLELWISGGILAVLGMAALLWAFWRRCARLWRAVGAAARDERSIWAATVALGLAGAMAATVVHGMVDSAYFVPDLALIFWMMVALLIGLARLEPARRNILRLSRESPV
ncbi:MAG TPA: O-antigen ligase family protein [Ktedonobacterales bacterium]|nr:O-antigen ligase family protein [Ktedonobacterales bacterium]